MRGNHTLMFLSLSISLPSLVSKNKYIKYFLKKKKGKNDKAKGWAKRGEGAFRFYSGTFSTCQKKRIEATLVSAETALGLHS